MHTLPSGRSYQISHFIEDEAYDIKDTLDIAEAPTLRKAKQLAGWYYKEWLSVNQNTAMKKRQPRLP